MHGSPDSGPPRGSTVLGDHPDFVGTRDGDAVVCGSSIDDDYLGGSGLLRLDTGEGGREMGSSVADGNNDGDGN